MKKYEPTYWNHKGKYQKLYDLLYGSLVPMEEGKADTQAGEILRIVSKLYYDVYNNGGCNIDVLAKGIDMLFVYVPIHMEILTVKFTTNPPLPLTNKYMKFLDLYMDWAINYANMLNVLSELETDVNAGVY